MFIDRLAYMYIHAIAVGSDSLVICTTNKFKLTFKCSQEKGNEFVKMGKKYYKDAVDCYTRAIDQKSMDAMSTSVLYANRAQVHLLLGNNRRALVDAQQALELNKANLKVFILR